MALAIPNEKFEELIALAGPLIERARAVCAGAAPLPNETLEENILTDEANALSTAIMGVIRTSPLADPAVFVALGGLIGILMAQSMNDHAGLWKLVRNQTRETYDEMIGSARTTGPMQ